ncbi:hypothetical protein L0156_06850 [bacterium]|nr:hypothetical protein [bacterium]
MPGQDVFTNIVSTSIRPFFLLQLNSLDHIDSILESILGAEKLRNLDRFERVQLADVVSICKQSRSLSEAGRRLYSASRKSKKISNDADRLRKYLARFDLTWQALQE